MAIRECDCKEFQDLGHTDECNQHHAPTRKVHITPPVKGEEGYGLYAWLSEQVFE